MSYSTQMSVDDSLQRAAALACMQLLSHYVIRPTGSQALQSILIPGRPKPHTHTHTDRNREGRGMEKTAAVRPHLHLLLFCDMAHMCLVMLLQFGLQYVIYLAVK